MISWFLSLTPMELFFLAIIGLIVGFILSVGFRIAAHYLFSRVCRELAFICWIAMAVVTASSLMRAMIMFLNSSFGSSEGFITPDVAASIGAIFGIVEPFFTRKKMFEDVNARIQRSRQQTAY